MIWKCKVCVEIFANRDRLSTHVRRDHNNESKICSECGRTFKNQYFLTLHTSGTHNRILSPCPICGKQFHGSTHLNIHLKSHSEERKYICDICGMKCKSRTSIKRHIKVIHCIKKLVNVRRLGPVQRGYKNTRLYCQLCRESFTDSNRLKDHLKHNHDPVGSTLWENLLNVLCVKCNVEFSSPNKLNDHNDSFHKFQCPICKQFMNTSETLRSHITMHSDKERPYKCEVI